MKISASEGFCFVTRGPRRIVGIFPNACSIGCEAKAATANGDLSL